MIESLLKVDIAYQHRCGTLWICIISCIYGGVSLLLPIGAGVKIKQPKNESAPLGDDEPKSVFKTEFELGGELPFMKTAGWSNFLHYGCSCLQAVTAAFLALCIMTRAGGFLNFTGGCIWLTGRVIINLTWSPFLYRVFAISGKEIDRLWINYAYFLIINIVTHIYCFIVIRFYTMEAWDLWRYRPVSPELRGRKRAKEKKQKGVKKGKPPKPKVKLSDWRRAQRQQKLEDQLDLAVIPIWRVRNEFIIYGEDYRGLDPARHFAAWERLERTGVLQLGENAVFDETKYQNILKNVDEEGNPNPIPKSQLSVKSKSLKPAESNLGKKSMTKSIQGRVSKPYYPLKMVKKKSKAVRKWSTLTVKKKLK